MPQCRASLQRYPGKNTAPVKRLERVDTVAGQCGVALPFSGKALVERSERRSKGIAVGPIQVVIAPGTRAGLSQNTEREPVLDQNLNGWPSNRGIERVVNVGSEAEYNLFSYVESRVLGSVLAEFGEKIRSWRRTGIELLSRHSDHVRNVTIGATVTAATIWISGEWRILARLPTGRVDVRAPFD